MNRRALNQINNTLGRLQFKNEKPFYKKGEFYVSLTLGIIAIFLTIIAMVQTETLSNQQQQIKGFDSLLNNSTKQTDTLNKVITILSKQLFILASQLKINEEHQKLLNIQAGYTNDANEIKFRIAEQEMKLLIFSYPNTKPNKLIDWDSTSRKEFLNSFEKIIKNELDNPFLLKSSSLAKIWNEVYHKISNYYFESNFYPRIKEPLQLKKDLDLKWRDCFGSISALSMDATNYINYSQSHNIKNLQYKTWNYNNIDAHN